MLWFPFRNKPQPRHILVEFSEYSKRQTKQELHMATTGNDTITGSGFGDSILALDGSMVVVAPIRSMVAMAMTRWTAATIRRTGCMAMTGPTRSC
jgi:hypothetical protein